MQSAIDTAAAADPAIDLAPTPGPAANIGPIVRAVALLVGMGAAALLAMPAIAWLAPGDLVWPIPFDAYGLATGAAVLLILLALWRGGTRRRRSGPFGGGGGGRSATDMLDALVCGPIILAVVVCVATRFCVQAVGFAGLHPAAAAVPFVVTDTDAYRRKGGGHMIYELTLRYAPGGRYFDRDVSRAVFEAARVGDTVDLPVETGRFGVQRAMAPRLATSDLHHPG